jgi:hypothetical protein
LFQASLNCLDFWLLSLVLIRVFSFVALLLSIEHVVVHVLALRFEVAAQVNFSGPLHVQSHILRAVDVVVQILLLISLIKICDDYISLFTVFGEQFSGLFLGLVNDG